MIGTKIKVIVDIVLVKMKMRTLIQTNMNLMKIWIKEVITDNKTLVIS